jgi:hypothetical protein
MANIVVQPGRMAFKMKTDEIKDEKPVYKSVGLGSVKGGAGAESLAEVAAKIVVLLPWEVEQITLQRTEILEI